jgi:hypothetical protein
MKSITRSRIFTTLLAVALLPLLSQFCRADDVADAKTEFATFLQYQKTDDPKILDMFTKDCVVKMTMTDGTREQSQVIPTAAFLQMITDALPKKEGNHDKYENITAKQDGVLVRVQCTLSFTDMNGKQEPFAVAFTRDTDGKLRIKEFSITLPAPSSPGTTAAPAATGATPATTSVPAAPAN